MTRPAPTTNARVLVILTNRTGTVVGTRSELRDGTLTADGFYVRFDGAAHDGPWPLFTADMLVVLGAELAREAA